MSEKLLRIAASVLLGLSVSAPADAQNSFQEMERASRNLLFDQHSPFGGLAEYAHLSRAWSVNTFYTVFRGHYPSQSKFWVVRRVSGAPGEAQRVLWADSRSCSGVESALIAMERMPVVWPDAPQLRREAGNLGVVLDGTHHIFWNRVARSGPNNATVGLEITGNVNSPIARWWAATADDLSACWQTATPE